MEFAILAVVVGPSLAIFLLGCLIAATRSWTNRPQANVRIVRRGRAV